MDFSQFKAAKIFSLWHKKNLWIVILEKYSSTIQFRWSAFPLLSSGHRKLLVVPTIPIILQQFEYESMTCTKERKQRKWVEMKMQMRRMFAGHHLSTWRTHERERLLFKPVGYYYSLGLAWGPPRPPATLAPTYTYTHPLLTQGIYRIRALGTLLTWDCLLQDQRRWEISHLPRELVNHGSATKQLNTKIINAICIITNLFDKHVQSIYLGRWRYLWWERSVEVFDVGRKCFKGLTFLNSKNRTKYTVRARK